MHIFHLATDRPPLATHLATRPEQVTDLLNRAQGAASMGRYVVVMVSYDAASAFDAAMGGHDAGDSSIPAGDLPLAWMAEFDELSPAGPARPVDEGRSGQWPVFTPSIDKAEFCRRVTAVQARIAAGDTYQANLTFPLHATSPDDTTTWFERLRATQEASFAACLDLGRTLVLSLSPELFFEVVRTDSTDPRIRTRPMKGTIRRGRWLAEDQTMARTLADSAKDQAENVMIVDLLRNDIGRVAETGSVRVTSLFDIEPYPTLWQMTSTVEGALRPDVTLAQIFAALFPCGSVTGAPKIRTMEIIRDLEGSRRGLYTGAIGLLEPGGHWTFSVAIRTLVLDRQTGVATMGVGAGITADSVPADEYDECLLKAAFTSRRPPERDPFELLETMRLEHRVVVRLERHLRRMADSARFFGYQFDESEVRDLIARVAAAHPDGIWRLRVTSNATGAAKATAVSHQHASGDAWRVAFANAPIDATDPFLCNKTTSRSAYDIARRGRPDVDDVLLWNGRREVTESTIANLVVEIAGTRYTPPVTCGLLAGTLRAELLDAGEIAERVMTRGEVVRAERLWLINSLRGWIDAVLVR